MEKIKIKVKEKYKTDDGYIFNKGDIHLVTEGILYFHLERGLYSYLIPKENCEILEITNDTSGISAGTFAFPSAYDNFKKMDLKMDIWLDEFEIKKWKMPTIELVKYDKKKGTTVVKFKNIKKAVKSKCNPNEKFSEFEGLVTCLLKQASGMTNQELKRYLEHADKKTIK